MVRVDVMMVEIMVELVVRMRVVLIMLKTMTL